MPEVFIDGVEYVPFIDEPADLPEGYLSPHFRKTEFDCNHCGKYGETISKELLTVLEDVRAKFGTVVVNSGVRCRTHNTNVGGAHNSRHLVGNADAADIVCPSTSVSNLRSYLLKKYPDRYGIGKYDSFVHIDVRPGGPARW